MLDYDSETNTDHAQFRQYSSIEGRWLRPDPYSGSYRPRNPQSFNRYEYAMNNPLSNVDPIGLKPIPCPGGLPTVAENGDYIANGCDDGGVVNCDSTDPNCGSTSFQDQSYQFNEAALESMQLGNLSVNAPSNGTPWYKTCTAKALGKGAVNLVSMR
jgi:RHS repeat-associated protein